MFLKNLIIENNDTLIRSITFKKGVNLILDETKTPNRNESGNNVGKTTILRLIDFCFGGDGKNIYQDKEFKQKSNTQIEKYLTENNTIITLTLSEDIDKSDSREIVIKRNFRSRNAKKQEINGTAYDNLDFLHVLKELIFETKDKKPSIRQIIAKNIRDEKNKLINTLKVLPPYANFEEYETLFLFLLGIDQDGSSKKQELLRIKTSEENLQKSLKKQYSLSQIKQSLIIINRTIQVLKKKKESIDLQEGFKNQIEELNELNSKINSISTELSRLEFRKTLILESKDELERDHSEIDTNLIKEIYTEAKALIPNLHKSYEETIEFHNQMLKEKMKYITKELPALEENIRILTEELLKRTKLEEGLKQKLNALGVFAGFESLIDHLNINYQKKGSLEKLEELWTNSIKKLKEVNTEIDSINQKIRSKDSLIQKRITEFNKFFSDISSKLYGESFVLSSDITSKGLELNISSISGNLGTGKKKGQIAAFDLAYIEFADQEHIRCLHFILHDQIENVHNNQISLLFDIVNSINCQYIIPILRDKLPPDIDITKHRIISLSQSDKLFKVD